jgi:tripartite-type tricarboxylate transporter receptor subunit TctC
MQFEAAFDALDVVHWETSLCLISKWISHDRTIALLVGRRARYPSDNPVENDCGFAIMKVTRRRFSHVALAAVTLPVMSRLATAGTYPLRPVRILVGAPAGGGIDITARLIGQWLLERLGQQFVVENRPGAGGNIAAEAAVRAPADGYTLYLATPANAINATLYENLTFNFIREIAPVGALINVPLVIVVNPSLPIKTVLELIAYAKANPGKLNMALGGTGGVDHVAGALFKLKTGVNLTFVPYRGLAPALTDLIGGQVHVIFSSITAAIQYVRAGTLRALAVTSAERAHALPELPTVGEIVPGVEASQWYGIVGPRGTPAEIVNTLNKAINAGLVDSRLKTRFSELGGVALIGSPDDFGKLIADETEKWGKVIRAANIKPV